ncbi:MAG: PDZ domain-containing protein [Gammaproteobacteria bacterium]
MKKILAALASLLVTSCVNPYAQFYNGMPDARERPDYAPGDHGTLAIYSTNNFNRDTLMLMRRGYMPMGQSAFNAASNRVSSSQLEAEAAKVGADVVLVSSRYTGTVTGAIPYQVPQTTTSYSTGTATAYGPGGVVNAYGQGTTTTYGSQTMMMPYAINRSDFAARFFVKVQAHVGIIAQPLDDDTRQRLETNAGVRVLTVMDGSPAFRADILPGDVVLTVNNESVDSVEGYSQLLTKYEGQTVPFRIDRNGKKFNRQIEDIPYKKVTVQKSQ